MNIVKEYPELKVLQKIATDRSVELFLIGGFIRDLVLGRTQNDLDFSVQQDAIKIAQEFSHTIRGSFVLLDEENGCARVIKKRDGKVVTFDFADYRAESIKEDLKKRDFTLNALAVDVLSIIESDDLLAQVLDVTHGLKDIAVQMIRMVSVQAFKDDPLRMMRAYSLRAILGFSIDEQTVHQISLQCKSIRTVSKERVRDEFFKILNSARTYEVIQEMKVSGILDYVIPQLKIMVGVEQGGYHHLDVWNHTLEAVRQQEEVFQLYADNDEVQSFLNEEIVSGRTRRALIKLGILLHDVGKPKTRKFNGERMTFYAHDKVGKDITTTVARRLKLSTHERHIVEDLVFHHLRPGYLSNEETPTQRSIYRFYRATKDEAVSVLLLSMADQRATCGPMTDPGESERHHKLCADLIAGYFRMKKEKPQVRLISGDDLIKVFHIKPSKLFADLLNEVDERQALHEISTKEQALDFVRTKLLTIQSED